MSMIPPYGKIFHIGSPECSGILEGEIYLQEKIDGSQFSFCKLGGVMHYSSKTVPFTEDEMTSSQKMFFNAVEGVKSVSANLPEGMIFRGEYLQKPKHNVLCYDRIPKNYIIIFDVLDNDKMMPPEIAEKFCIELGFEFVPCEKINGLTLPTLQEYLNRTSCLGTVRVEGAVIKNYAKFSPYGGTLMAKFVSEEFKEVHKIEWKENKASHDDVKEIIGLEVGPPARYLKSIQRLQEAGKLTYSPKDIGKMFDEVKDDIKIECEGIIKERLFGIFWPHISRVATRGIPQFYKEWLAKRGFEEAKKD